MARFYVAWNGKGAGSFAGVFRTKKEADSMTWENNEWASGPFTVSPSVTEWVVEVQGGNPVIITPSAVFDGLNGHDLEGVPAANVYAPYRGDSQYNRLMPTGVPLAEKDLGRLSQESPEYYAVIGFNRAREALLKYCEEYE